MNDLVSWLLREIEDRGWSQAELARRSGVSPAGVSQILSEQRSPTAEWCIDIARGLRIPPEDVLRRAGHLPPASTDAGIDARAAWLIHQLRELLALLPPDQQERIMAHTIFQAEILVAAANAIARAERAEDQSQELSRK